MDRNWSPVAVEFLFTELHAGLTFASLAISAKAENKKKIERNTKNARKAYDKLLQFQEQVSLSPEENLRFVEGRERLRASLQRLGERV